MKWTQREVAKAVWSHAFNGRYLLLVPDCQWTGYECDLLVVRDDLRLVDVEIKVTRADLKVDRHKSKWFVERWGRWLPNDLGGHRQEVLRTPREFPPKIWKHYYCLPATVWRDGDLEAEIPAVSGVITISDGDVAPYAQVRRQAKPNREAQPVSPRDVISIARLACWRMMDAYSEVDRACRAKTELVSV